MAITRNSNLVGELLKLARIDHLGHAYLFFGESKDEIKQEALTLAKALEAGWEEAGRLSHGFTHAPKPRALARGMERNQDIAQRLRSYSILSRGLVRDSALGEKPRPLGRGGFTLVDAKVIDSSGKESLGIDVVREIKNFLWRRPVKSKKRTVIISDAEELTPEAQNATLKILEDAPPTALIIFIATNPDRLLPTVISRMQKVFVPALPDHRASKKSAPNSRARELAVKFLSSSATLRYALSKEIAEEEKEGSPNLTLAFLDELIGILKEKPQNNTLFLKELLNRRRLLGEYSLNKRLQLAFLSNLWYNGRD